MKGEEGMSQNNLAKYLKAVTAALVLVVTVVYVGCMPGIIQVFLERDAIVHKDGIYPWLGLISLTCIPVYISLYHFWRVTVEIGRDNSFSNENAVHLKWISQMCLLDAGYFFVGNLVFYGLQLNGVITLCCAMIVVFVTICVSVLAAVLSHLIYKAAKLQEENQLTI